jgi:hypothetical protein
MHSAVQGDRGRRLPAGPTSFCSPRRLPSRTICAVLYATSASRSEWSDPLLCKADQRISFGRRRRRRVYLERAELVEPLLIVRRALREQIVILHRRLLAIVRDDEVCRRLMTTPGVGPLVALTYRATVDVPARFRKSKSVGAVFPKICDFRCLPNGCASRGRAIGARSMIQRHSCTILSMSASHFR